VIDNRRYLSVRVEESVKILLVDGNPTANPLDRSTFHLEAALLPQDDSLGAVSGRITPFEPRYVPWNQLSDVDWKDYSAVILANVSELPPEQVDALKAYVRGGGALIVFLGPDVQPEFYNKFFREGKESLLPGNLEVVRGDPRYPVYLEIADENHPIARYFAEHREVTHMARPLIAFYRYYQVGGVGRVAGPGEATPGVRVFFRYNDTEKSPAMFDTGYGSGRVVWVTSTADQEWNDLSIWPDFVVFLYETISYAVRFGMSSSNLEVGEVFRKTYPSSQYASEVLCLTPDSAGGRSARSVPKAMRNLAGGSEFELTHEETQVPGIYRLDLLRPSIPDGNSVEYFTVNVNTEESQLKSMTDEDFQTHYPELQYKVFDVSQRVRVAEEEKNLLRGREYWKWILAVVLMLAVAETIAAYLFGRRNR